MPSVLLNVVRDTGTHAMYDHTDVYWMTSLDGVVKFPPLRRSRIEIEAEISRALTRLLQAYRHLEQQMSQCRLHRMRWHWDEHQSHAMVV